MKLKAEGIDLATTIPGDERLEETGGQWQIVAAHMAFVLDPKQAAMLSGEGR